MKLTLHHLNMATENVARMDRFYRDILGLERETAGLPVLEKTKGYAGDVTFVTDGAIQTHLAQRDIHAGFATGQIVNPVSHGHIAYRTDDLSAFRAHLENHGIPYSDWGHAAVAGWHQIFFYDPDGNVIEVHQVGGPSHPPETSLLAELETCERQVWDALVTGDQDSDAARLDDGFLGVYPDGFSGKAAHVAQLADGPTINTYDLNDMRCVDLGADHAMLCYQATFTRAPGSDPERMYVSSIWKRWQGGWINLFSQDTPAAT
ncbi:DUF4440 domain-containing protein [Sedimentitalea nanhaiensis]|uniref:Catechol 2,3-dioxygenase n=1 Tax=Sedimentitalea nanhaiensis TaxID=999627 RepID=A0A1I6Y6N4_9RHOB|nr:DUF4440 domain-containing protein [Sedimentitalea nanhaiensis]SFT46120.1 Catechol 2,3-dioxygenase [Sedimentitalea nanhaiensis]